MRNTWGKIVARLFYVCGKTINITTANPKTGLGGVYKDPTLPPVMPLVMHVADQDSVSYKAWLLNIFHTPNNKLLFKLISL
jgi:hypothetical protein